MAFKKKLAICFLLLFNCFFSSLIYASYKPTDSFVCHYISPGDTLSAIALKYLGNARFFNLIAELNNIKDPNFILPNRYIRVELNPLVVSEVKEDVVKQKQKQKPEPTISKQRAEEIPVLVETKWHGLRYGLTYGGGGGLLQVGTDFYAGPALLNISAGIGLGQNYSMANVQLSKEFVLSDDYRLGVSGVYAYYSKYIINVPWTYQNLNRGDNFGWGIYLSRDINEWEIKTGFSPLLGAHLGISRYL